MTTKKTPRTCDFCGKDIVSEIKYRIQISKRGATGSFKKGQTRKFIKADNDADMCHPCFVIMQGHGYEAKFTKAGFVDVTVTDATDWYRAEARREYDLVKGELFPRMVELLGQSDADHFVENWRAIVVVIDKGEMRQGYCRGRRPA